MNIGRALPVLTMLRVGASGRDQVVVACLTLCLTLLASTAPARAEVIYALDDGTSEVAIGADTPGDDLFIANIFEAAPGGDVITAVDIAFGSPATSVGAPPTGLPLEIIIYDDPDNDFDLSDRVRLTAVNAAVESPGQDLFVRFAIDPTAVMGSFAVAVFFEDLPDALSPIGGDADMPLGRSVGVQDNVDPDTEPSLFVLPSNAMIRAVGDNDAEPVPEPAAVALLALGLVLVPASRAGRRLPGR